MKLVNVIVAALLLVCTANFAEAKEKEPASKQELVRSIVADAATERQKAYAIFEWIAHNISYDVSFKIVDAEGALKHKKGVCAAYSSLFNEFCDLAGLESVSIGGYAKSIFYNYDNILSKPNHDWNAVKIDGTWLLVDATWGAGYVANGVFTKEFEPSWFDVDPVWLIFTHFPENPQWQMRAQPLTLKAFWDLPPLKPEMARLGFEAGELFAYFAAHPRTAFPLPYSFPVAVKVKKMPLTRTLSSKTTYEFAFEIPEGAKVALVSKGKFITGFTQEGNLHSMSIAPEAGDLTVMVSSGGTHYDGMFQYTVKK